MVGVVDLRHGVRRSSASGLIMVTSKHEKLVLKMNNCFTIQYVESLICGLEDARNCVSCKPDTRFQER